MPRFRPQLTVDGVVFQDLVAHKSAIMLARPTESPSAWMRREPPP